MIDDQDTPAGGPDVTRLLRDWHDKQPGALERLIPVVYQELHALAVRYMSREHSGHTLQPTALVHEAFVRLSGQRSVDWQNRAHFYGLAAQIMRRLLVDHARRSGRSKRGGHAEHVSLDAVSIAAPPHGDPIDALALDEALTKLAAIDAEQARVIELRYFGGMTLEETADVLGVSTGTVKRQWTVARAWLYREISGPGGE